MSLFAQTCCSIAKCCPHRLEQKVICCGLVCRRRVISLVTVKRMSCECGSTIGLRQFGQGVSGWFIWISIPRYWLPGEVNDRGDQAGVSVVAACAFFWYGIHSTYCSSSGGVSSSCTSLTFWRAK